MRWADSDDSGSPAESDKIVLGIFERGDAQVTDLGEAAFFPGS